MRLPYVSFLRRASFGRPGRPPNVHARSSAGFPETKESLAYRTKQQRGAIAQLGERWLCKPEVAGSIPAGSTDVKGSPRGGSDCDCRGKCAGPRPSPRGDPPRHQAREHPASGRRAGDSGFRHRARRGHSGRESPSSAQRRPRETDLTLRVHRRERMVEVSNLSSLYRRWCSWCTHSESNECDWQEQV